MFDANSVFLRGIQEMPRMTEHVKRSSGGAGFFLVIYLILNVLIFFPFLLFVGPHPALLEPLLTPLPVLLHRRPNPAHSSSSRKPQHNNLHSSPALRYLFRHAAFLSPSLPGPPVQLLLPRPRSTPNPLAAPLPPHPLQAPSPLPGL